jgi:hypothetical protein
MALTYGFNMYFNSANPGQSIADPTQPPTGWGGGSTAASWYSPQHWNWDAFETVNETPTWVNEGSGILHIPPDGNMPQFAGDVGMSIRFLDTNIDESAAPPSSVGALNAVAIQVVFAFGGTIPADPPVMNSNYLLPGGLSMTTSWDNTTGAFILLISTNPGNTNTESTAIHKNGGYSTDTGPAPDAAVWSIQLTPTESISGCTSAEVSAWIQLSMPNNQPVVQYCIDPEMQMDEQN